MSSTIIVDNQSRSEQNSRPGEWVVFLAPAANTQATVTKAAPPAGYRHVVTAINGRLVGGASAPTAAEALLNLIFGATGGTPVASWALGIQATAGQVDSVTMTGMDLEVTAATAVTLEFAAAGGANTYESVVMTGYTKNVDPGAPLN